MSVLAQIASWIPDRIIDNLAKKHKIQTRAFSANSHLMAMLYAHLALNMRSFLPNFVIVKSAKDSDQKSAWELCAEMKAGEIAVFDKAYVDFKHLKVLDARSVS